MVEYKDNAYFKGSMTMMEHKFNKYFVAKQHPMLFALATIFHPTQKRVWLNALVQEIFTSSDGMRLMSNVDYNLKLLYDEYKSSSRETSEDVLECPSMKYGGTLTKISKQIQNTMFTGATSELNNYLEGCLEDMDVDVLAWWKINQSKYPMLNKIARDILAVPASTVVSKASFSTGGRVINEYKTRLKPNLVESLVVSKDWDRADKRVQDTDADKIIKEDFDLAKEYTTIPDFVDT